MASRLKAWNTRCVSCQWKRFAILGCALIALGGSAANRLATPAHAEEVLITVTSPLDDTGDDVPACPSDTLCTLRQALETANADASNDPVRIIFDPAVFDPDDPPTIEIADARLPTLSRPGVIIDGSMASVMLRGQSLTGPEAIGISIDGAASGVIGLAIRDFAAACVVLNGDGAFAGEPSQDGRNRLDDCAIGVLATGVGAVVGGDTIGLDPADLDLPVMQTGIVAAAAGVIVGTTEAAITPYNAIGNVTVGVSIGRGAGDEFAGVAVQHNLIGATYEHTDAPVTTGVLVDHPSIGSQVTDNAIHNATTGIAVAADSEGLSSTGNILGLNTFDALGGLAIDLGADGLRNPNDDGDLDTGPNTLLNSPVVSTSTQAVIAGTSCPGCRVLLYGVHHTAGGEGDYPLDPIIGGDVFADDEGTFAVASPLVSPGDWLMAITMDAEGNTSEFSGSFYLGAGTAQCGNVSLHSGWNFAGYFGGTASLDSGVLSDQILSVHELIGGSYASWFPDGPSNLAFLQTGEPYWFYSTGDETLAGGVSLSTGLPVALSTGWNDFVYIGAPVSVADALASLGDSWTALYRFENSGETPGKWRSYGGPDTPAFAHAFEMMEPCTAFRILMTSDQAFVPLEP